MNEASSGRARIPWRWTIVAALMLLTLTLGCVGFREYYHVRGVHKSWADAVYLSLQLFTLSSGAVDGPVNWQLEVARFLGPVAAALCGRAGDARNFFR